MFVGICFELIQFEGYVCWNMLCIDTICRLDLFQRAFNGYNLYNNYIKPLVVALQSGVLLCRHAVCQLALPESER